MKFHGWVIAIKWQFWLVGAQPLQVSHNATNPVKHHIRLGHTSLAKLSWTSDRARAAFRSTYRLSVPMRLKLSAPQTQNIKNVIRQNRGAQLAQLARLANPTLVRFPLPIDWALGLRSGVLCLGPWALSLGLALGLKPCA